MNIPNPRDIPARKLFINNLPRRNGVIICPPAELQGSDSNPRSTGSQASMILGNQGGLSFNLGNGSTLVRRRGN